MLDSLDHVQQETNTASGRWFGRLTTAINDMLPSSAPPAPEPRHADAVAEEVTRRLAQAVAARHR